MPWGITPPERPAALEMDDGLPCSATLQGLRLRIVEASRTVSADSTDVPALDRCLDAA